MKNTSFKLGFCATIVAASWVDLQYVAAATKVEKAGAAAKLVERTLQREAQEGIDDRGPSLAPAREQSPRYDAAWWQSGFVYDLKWREWLR